MKISVTYTNFDRDIESIEVAFDNNSKQGISLIEKDVVVGVDENGLDIIETQKFMKLVTGDGITSFEEEINQEKLAEYISLLNRVLRQTKQ